MKNSVAELLSLAELVDELPREVFAAETMIAALFDAALARPLPEPKPQTIVVQQEQVGSKKTAAAPYEKILVFFLKTNI